MGEQFLDDLERVERMLAAFDIEGVPVYAGTISVAPAAKRRARFTKTGRSYMLAGDREAEEYTAVHLQQIVKQRLIGNVALACLFFRPNRQRIDVDNLVKHVCDAGNGVAWADDSQVTAIAASVELDREMPRTVLAIARHRTTLVRDLGGSRTCLQCSKPFTVTRAKAQGLCSRQCQIDSMKGRNRAQGQEHAPCIVCGGKTSKPGVLRCRQCWTLRGSEEKGTDEGSDGG